MRTHLGAGWYIAHLSDRVIELRKEDATYRRFTGRDGFVRFRGEPGMDRQALIAGAVHMAQRNDADLAERVAKRLMPRHVTRFRAQQQQLARIFGTGEEPELIGGKMA